MERRQADNIGGDKTLSVPFRHHLILVQLFLRNQEITVCYKLSAYSYNVDNTFESVQDTVPND